MRSCKCDDCKIGCERRDEIRRGGVTEEELPHRSAPKNTKKWCKGKVGREHEPHVVQYPWYNITECKNCGKHINYRW